MSEKGMNALPFELSIKNCKSCSIETLPISVLSFQLIVQGEGESRSRRLWLRNTESTAFRKLHETLFSDKFLFQSCFVVSRRKVIQSCSYWHQQKKEFLCCNSCSNQGAYK